MYCDATWGMWRADGCWLWPTVGSGVYINVGSTLGFGTRLGARRAFRPAAPLQHDGAFANFTRSLGYDTLQLLQGNSQLGRWHLPPIPESTRPTSELVVAHGGCVDSRAPLPGACVPAKLRTGLNASMPCVCRDDASPFLNCASG